MAGRPGNSEFSVSMSQVAETLGARLETVCRRATLQLVTEIIRKSPVDTGMFKGSWVHGVGMVNNDQPGTADGAMAASLGRVSQSYRGSPVAGVHFFSNNLPYAARLEFDEGKGRGYSDQARDGMVLISIIELLAEMDAILEAARNGHRIR